MTLRRAAKRAGRSTNATATGLPADFEGGLAGAIAADLAALASARVQDVVDPATVRGMLERADLLVNREVVVEVVITAGRRIRAELQRRQVSLVELFDAEVVDQIEALLQREVVLSADAEDLISRMVGRELIQDLLTDVVHTSIVSFNKKVNPLFGGLATSMLEGQIKGFIRLFMPLASAQATAFVVDRRNQELLSDFAGSLVRELLDEPIPVLLSLISADDGDDAAARLLVGKLIADEKLRSFGRALSLAAWDATFAAIRKRRVGELVRLDEHLDWLAESAAHVLLAGLERPHLRAFLATELTKAGAGAPPSSGESRKPRRKPRPS